MEINSKYIAQKEYKPTPEIPNSEPPEIRIRENQLCSFRIQTAIYPYDDYYQAVCTYLGVSCHLKSREETQKAITDLIDAHIDGLLEMGTLEEVLTRDGWDKKQVASQSGTIDVWTNRALD